MKNYYYIFLLLLSAIFLAFLSWTTSPLYDSYGWDSAIFMLTGKGILENKILYKDLFDHKGPILFSIQAIGQLIYLGRWGIFIVQIINLSIILFFIQKISLFFTSKAKSWIVIGFSLVFLTSTLQEGNTSEEFSLVFLFISLYLVLKNFFEHPTTYLLKYTFIYGLCFSTVVFIRANNAAPLAAIIATIGLLLIINKKWIELLKHIAVFSSALLLVTGFIFFYFYRQDALMDMLYGTFIFNFKYGVEDSQVMRKLLGLPFLKLAAYCFLILSFLVASTFIYNKKHKNKNELLILSIFMSIFTFFGTLMGKAFIHYQVITVVPLVLSISIALNNLNNIQLKQAQRRLCIIAGCCIILPFVSFFKFGVWSCWRAYNSGGSDYFPLTEIPEKEKYSVIGYDVESSWFLRNNMLPCYKYFQSHRIQTVSDPQIKEDFNSMVINDLPLWVMINIPSENPELVEILQNKYVVKSKNEEFILYSLNEEYRTIKQNKISSE